MKKIIFIKFFILALLVTSCSKEDDSSGDLLSNVPSGEIVPVEQREVTLIGYDVQSQAKSYDKQQAEAEQKWWKHGVSKVTYDCSGYDESDNMSETLENTYFAFKENGTIYYKVGMSGAEMAHLDWEWEDSKKEAIIVQGVSFKFTELNPSTVTYASVQGESGCEVLTWEQFTN